MRRGSCRPRDCVMVEPALSHESRAIGWTILAIVATLLLAVSPALARWPDAQWNPKPQDDDLVLPLPCDGAIAFRPVATPMAEGALADRPATLGQVDPETDYAEFLRQAFLAGPFP